MRPARHYVPLIVALSILSGCTSLGNIATKTGKVLRDPSIPIGPPGEQPTVVSLSMHATHRVNPNPASMEVTVNAEPERPERFSVSLASDSEEELALQMRATLKVMEKALDAQSSPWLTVQPVVLAMQDESDEPSSGRADASIVASDTGRTFASNHRDVGQYDGVLAERRSFDSSPDGGPIATPVRFKVLQLRDDAMLLNADVNAIDGDLRKALGSTYVSDDDYVLQPGQFKFIDSLAVREGVHFIAVVAMFHDMEGATWKRVFRVQPRGRRYPLLITFDATVVDVIAED